MITKDIEKLKVPSKPTTQEEVKKLDIENRMKEAIKTAWVNGYGLAAIQIGEPLRFAWYRWQGEDKFLLNPKLIDGNHSMRMNNEGCLSIPNVRLQTKRFYDIVYENDGKQYAAKGIEAQIIQHEIDHMDGLTIYDRNVSK